MTLEPNFEVATQGAAVLDPAPWTALNTLASDSPRSRDGFADPAMDATLTELRAASNNEEIIAALEEFQRVWNETFPYVVFNHAIWAVLVQDDVHGMEYGPDVTPYFTRAWSRLRTRRASGRAVGYRLRARVGDGHDPSLDQVGDLGGRQPEVVPQDLDGVGAEAPARVPRLGHERARRGPERRCG